MADRTIVVRLRAEVSDFKRAMAEAASASDKALGAADRNGQKIDTVLGRMVQSAQVNGQAWTTAGQAMLGLGTAITAVGAAALKTGIAYNTLQQQSRAALGTLLGDAQAANAQMDKLDEFARTSPFAKDVFIRAQQQMLGFGIETKKVIPYLDAAQNAVAAFGGSNYDLSEVVRIMSQISATSKITATDLREFGNRGIDAATLIGSQMNMTGAEIREAITAGTIDAQAALDALAAGMQERFGGAAAGVKSTFVGAMDRVKAAWRDLASEFATPLIDPDGGGLLVEWMNNLADVMRAVQGLPDWVKTTAVAFGAIVAVGALLSGTFLVLTPRIVATYTAFQQLSIIAPRAATAIRVASTAFGAISAVLAVATAAFSLYTLGTSKSQKANQALVDSLDKATGALTENSRQIVYNSLVSSGAVDAAKKLGVNLEDLTDAALGNAEAQARVTAQIDAYRRANIDSLETQSELSRALPKYSTLVNIVSDAIGKQNDEVNKAVGAFNDAKEAQLKSADATEEVVAVTDEARTAVELYNEALKEQIDLARQASGVALDEWDALTKYAEAVNVATVALYDENGVLIEVNQTLDENTKMGRENRDALADIADATWDWIDSGVAAGVTTGELNDRMNEGRQAFIDAATQMGLTSEEAAALADQMNLIPSVIHTKFETPGLQTALDQVRALNAEVKKSQGSTRYTVSGYNTTGGSTFADGGPVFGPGTGTSDSIPAWLSNGEHVWTAREVAAAGGHGAIEDLRRAVVRGYATGGGVGVVAPVASRSDSSPLTASLSDYQIAQVVDGVARAVRTGARLSLDELASTLTLAGQQGGAV